MSIDGFELLKSFVPIFISMLPLLLVLAIVVIIVLCIKNKVHIKFRTFRGKGFRPERGDFGLFVYCGSQGSEKVKLIH